MQCQPNEHALGIGTVTPYQLYILNVTKPTNNDNYWLNTLWYDVVACKTGTLFGIRVCYKCSKRRYN